MDKHLGHIREQKQVWYDYVLWRYEHFCEITNSFGFSWNISIAPSRLDKNGTNQKFLNPFHMSHCGSYMPFYIHYIMTIVSSTMIAHLCNDFFSTFLTVFQRNSVCEWCHNFNLCVCHLLWYSFSSFSFMSSAPNINTRFACNFSVSLSFSEDNTEGTHFGLLEERAWSQGDVELLRWLLHWSEPTNPDKYTHRELLQTCMFDHSW